MFFLVVKALKSVFDCFRVFLSYSFLPLCIIHKFKQISTEISHGISDSRLSPGSPGGHRILFHGCIQAPGQAGRQRNPAKILTPLRLKEFFAFPSSHPSVFGLKMMYTLGLALTLSPMGEKNAWLQK